MDDLGIGRCGAGHRNARSLVAEITTTLCAFPCALSCDDGNVCTDDLCDPAIGCINVPNTLPCDDGNACTIDDLCTLGSCVGTRIYCEDSDVCTTDTCDKLLGCVFTPNHGACDDGDACTSDDRCGDPRPIGFESFDATIAPLLPADWTSVATPAGANPWTTTTVFSVSAPNSATTDAPASASDKTLDSPPFQSGSGVSLVFDNRWNLESPCDGAVLEIRIGEGEFEDILSAGGRFETGGYNSSIPAACASPIAGRRAWSGSSGGVFVLTEILLPEIAAGQMVVARWRVATDTSFAATPPNGQWIDSAQLAFRCHGGPPTDCTDDDPCTVDSCNPAQGCVHQPAGCDDGDPCTIDSCDPVQGCVHVLDTCEDGNACTTNWCDPMLGCVYAPVVCDDGNPCTADGCDPTSGCWYVPRDGQPCEDGEACTGPDLCSGVQCAGPWYAPSEVQNLRFHDKTTIEFDAIPGIRPVMLFLQSDATASPATTYAQATRLDIGVIRSYEFVFPSPVAVTTAQPYFIRVTSPAPSVMFTRHDAVLSQGESDYAGGQFFVNGVPMDPSNPPGTFSDAYFTTYSVGAGGECSTPEEANAGWAYGHGPSLNARLHVLAQSFTPNRDYGLCKIRVVMWDGQYGTRFNLVRGWIGALPVGPGGMDEICMDADVPPFVDPTIPDVGTGLFHVIRAERACGNTGYGIERHNTAGGPVLAPRITTTCP